MPYEVDLAQGKGYALVDEEDYERVAQLRWGLHPRGYAQRVYYEGGETKAELMHRFIMGEPPEDGLDVDHINGDRLDNRRNNLRWASRSQNLQNSGKREGTTSRYKGVSWFARTGRWQVSIRINGKNYGLGYFTDEEEAARAYDEAAIEHFGEFARTNFPVTDYR